jgi:hypothetical protein
MINAAEHIEKDLYTYIKGSSLVTDATKKITGSVYRGETRPSGSMLEDVVVKYLSGYDMQFQTGICIVNIYVNDIAVKGYKGKLPNTARMEVLSEMLVSYIEDHYDMEYGWYIEETPVVLAAEEVGQHFINARVRFRRFTERNEN